MRNFLLILSVFWLWTCSGGGDKATGPEEPPIVINLTSLGGQAQKGPFNNGTAINIAELTNTLSPTGRNFSSAITDNTGRFAVANVQLESPYVELRANGYYFNEVSNEISSGQLTLFALSNLTGKNSLNVNILTHLEKNRMVTLMSGDNPKTFAQAKLQAQEEVLAIFDYSRANVPESELLDISQDGAANAKLLAMSAIIQGNQNVGQMSELLANISTDIASDGTLDDTNLRNTLIENSKNLDMAEVRSNLEARFTSLGITATIPDFESEINQFLKPPVANDMSASTGEDTPINITLAASDPEGESLTYTILEVNNATVTLNGNVANYTPDTNFNGTDTFTYYANDGTSDSNIATVTMTVSAEDDDPNTQNAAATTDEDVAVVLQLSAEEYDGDSYSFGIISEPTNGSVTLDGANATYTPNQDYNGTDSFTFEATDDTGRMMNVGTATITINPVNDAPVVTTTEVSVTTDEDTSVDITLSGSDVDEDNLTYNVIDLNNGTVSFIGNIATYLPNQDFNGTDTFTFNVNDGSVDSDNIGTVTISINPINDEPISNAMSVTMNEDESTQITLDGYDGDGDALTYSLRSDPQNGSVSLDGAIATYTPNADYYGTDSFNYSVNDGTSESNTSAVNITINGLPEKHTYDLSNHDYDEWFSDIVYDASTGGYIVTGYAQEVGDNGTSTISMLHLNTSSTNFEADVFTNDISGLDMINSGWGDRFGTAHSFDISERSRNGVYTVNNNGFLWTITNQGVATGSQASYNWSVTGDGDYQYIDNLSLSIEADDGSGFVVQGSIYGRESGGSPDRENFPVIIKTDNASEVQYYLALNYNTDTSKFYSWDARGIYSNEYDTNVYGFIGVEKRIGFSNQNTVWFYVVTDTGSSFEVNHRVDITNISSSMKLNDISWKHKEFAIHSMYKGQDARLTLLGTSSTGEDVIAGYFIDFPEDGSFDGHRLDGWSTIPDSDWYEMMNAQGSDGIYFACQSGSDILVRKYNQSTTAIMDEIIIDVDGNNSDDRFGGITHNNETGNEHGIVITGSTKCTTCNDFDGFIIELNESLERIGVNF